jgi:hypothetical protein
MKPNAGKGKELEAFKLRNINSMPGQGGDFYSKLNSMDLALEQAKLELEEAATARTVAAATG